MKSQTRKAEKHGPSFHSRFHVNLQFNISVKEEQLTFRFTSEANPLEILTWKYVKPICIIISTVTQSFISKNIYRSAKSIIISDINMRHILQISTAERSNLEHAETHRVTLRNDIFT